MAVGEERGLVDVLLKHGADARRCQFEDEKMIRQLIKAGAKPTRKQVESAQELDSKIAKLLKNRWSNGKRSESLGPMAKH